MDDSPKTHIIDELGWVHFRQALPIELLNNIRRQISDQLFFAGLRRLPFQSGELSKSSVRFYRRNPRSLASLQGMLVNLPSVYQLALHPLIGQLLERSVGWSQAALSPIHNLRAKLPWRLNKSPFTTVPWHQDYGASDPTVEDVRLLTLWIPLGPASARHGGLELIPRSNHLGWLPHARGERGPEVDLLSMKNALETGQSLTPVSVDAQAGDVIIFDQMMLHRSLKNHSRICRWSLDLRYAACGESTGRPGQWDRDPLVGERVGDEVMKLVRQRFNLGVPIRKRVDEELFY